jgi:1,4-alpha-glucan branching enzyme
MKLLPANRKKGVRFNLSAKHGSQVFVAGSFNKWNPTQNPLNDTPDSGHFKTVLHVPTGTHEYKFIVNGIWLLDPNCAEMITNLCGSQNSVFHV